MALVISAMLLVACSDSGSTAPTSAPVTTGAPVTTTTTVKAATTTVRPTTTAKRPPTTRPTPPTTVRKVTLGPGVKPAVVRGLQAGVSSYTAAFVKAAANPPNPNLPALVASSTPNSPTRRNAQKTIANLAAKGQALGPDSQGETIVEVITRVDSVLGNNALVKTCNYNATVQYEVATGRVVDDKKFSATNTALLVRGADGRWRIDTFQTGRDQHEVAKNPCS
jgi:hypothetical protein